jgi:hypothetical protein
MQGVRLQLAGATEHRPAHVAWHLRHLGGRGNARSGERKDISRPERGHRGPRGRDGVIPHLRQVRGRRLLPAACPEGRARH